MEWIIMRYFYGPNCPEAIAVLEKVKKYLGCLMF